MPKAESRSKPRVGTTNRSMAAMSGAWFRRKVRHPWLGGPRRLTMYLATLDIPRRLSRAAQASCQAPAGSSRRGRNRGLVARLSERGRGDDGFAHFHEMQQNQGRHAPSPWGDDAGLEIRA